MNWSKNSLYPVELKTASHSINKLTKKLINKQVGRWENKIPSTLFKTVKSSP